MKVTGFTLRRGDSHITVYTNKGRHQIRNAPDLAALLEFFNKKMEEADKMKKAMEWFCQRVDDGEVRSKRTYAVFKDILEAKLDKKALKYMELVYNENNHNGSLSYEE